MNSTVDKDGLVAHFHNRNLDFSNVMGKALPQTEQHHKGLYKAQMHRGTS